MPCPWRQRRKRHKRNPEGDLEPIQQQAIAAINRLPSAFRTKSAQRAYSGLLLTAQASPEAALAVWEAVQLVPAINRYKASSSLFKPLPMPLHVEATYHAISAAIYRSLRLEAVSSGLGEPPMPLTLKEVQKQASQALSFLSDVAGKEAASKVVSLLAADILDVSQAKDLPYFDDDALIIAAVYVGMAYKLHAFRK